MRVGGPAARLVTAETTDEVVDAVREVDDADEPLLRHRRRLQPRHRRRGLRRHASCGSPPRASPSSPPTCAAGVMVAGRGRRGLGRLRGAGRGRGLVGHRGAVRHPRVDRRHPGPERRRLRPGGRPDHRLGAGLGPRASSRCARSPRSTAPSPTATRSSRRTSRYVVLDVLFQLVPGELSPAGGLRRPRPPARRRRRGRGCRWPRPARRCWRSGGSGAWCSTPTTTTPGAAGPSSPTRSCRPERFAALRVPGCRRGWAPDAPAPPRFADAGRQRQDQRGLADRQGRVRQGLRACPAPARPVDQAHPGHHQPGRRHGRRRRGPGPRDPRRGARRVRRHPGQRAGVRGPRRSDAGSAAARTAQSEPRCAASQASMSSSGGLAQRLRGPARPHRPAGQARPARRR